MDTPEPTSSPDAPSAPPSLPRSFRERSGQFWARHRTLFWMLHSVWALTTGIAVLLLARERYSFIPLVVVFLVVTWASTLFFGRNAEHELEQEADEEAARIHAGSPSLRHEVASYVTRGLYQETLFFLLPFYAYSTVLSSVNVVFLILLGGLAILSCLDLLFDRWLRTKPVFGMIFFATVSFAAINLLIPMLFGLAPRYGTPLAAVIAVGSAVPLALRGGVATRRARVGVGLAVAVILGVAFGVQSVIPPVPLRMQNATFAQGIEPGTLELEGTLAGSVSADVVGDRLVVLVEVFAPASVPTRVRLDWSRDGAGIHSSRDVEIVAHEWRFRVWDSWRPEGGAIQPGRYVVTLRTTTGRIFGVASLVVT